ncbi:MAG: hypothetical protein CR993_07485 [Rhodobacterales bacterium]|nr:MAG: hypothetical protein CR993_07485 [Rhodobacterales bacterium]
MPSPRLDIQPRLERADLKSWGYRAPESDTLVISFSGIGKNPNAAPPIEFANTATQNGTHNALFISDPNRTWLNGDGLIERITNEARRCIAECKARRVVTVGHSMGGFSALVLADFLPVDAVLALAPQLSVHPDIVPDEHRWPEWREKITRFRVRCAADHLRDGPQYTVLFGRHGREAPQRDPFPHRDNLRLYILPRTHHNVPQRLKDLGILTDSFKFAIAGRPRKLRLLLKNRAAATLRPNPEP